MKCASKYTDYPDFDPSLNQPPTNRTLPGPPKRYSSDQDPTPDCGPARNSSTERNGEATGKITQHCP